MRTTAADGSLVIRGRVLVHRPGTEVIARIIDPSMWPRWQPEILSTGGPSHLEEGDWVDGRAEMLGFVVAGRSRAEEVAPDAFQEDVVVGVRMRIRYEVAASAEGTELVQTLIADLPHGVAGRLLSLVLRRRLRRMQARALANLVDHCEAARPG